MKDNNIDEVLELEVNWKTKNEDVGDILIKTLDLKSTYLWTDSAKYPLFGADSTVAKSCFPTIPMLMTNHIKSQQQEIDRLKSTLNKIEEVVDSDKAMYYTEVVKYFAIKSIIKE